MSQLSLSFSEIIITMAFILLSTIILVYFIMKKRRSQKGSLQSHTQSGDLIHSSDGAGVAHQIMEQIRLQRQKAQDSIDRGELRKAKEQLSKLLEHLYRNMAKLAPLGPKNSSEIKDEVEYTLDETTAKILLNDLQETVDAVEDICSVEMNLVNQLENGSRLDSLNEKGNMLADEVDRLAEKRDFDYFKDE
ncbi:MAG: hypothetical protein ACFFF4_13415, partial [Candidatus Thorarchaeota archaeon]